MQLRIEDRAAAQAATVEKARRIVMLRTSWDTQEKLREWSKQMGFDLAWSYSGWPQSSWDFDFHVTVVASSNEVRIPDGARMIDPLTIDVAGYAVLGVDRSIPTLKLEANKTLSAIREFFISTYGVKPTFEDFKPHVSLSYKWDGEPPVEEFSPLPPFPLVFDVLMVSTLDEPAKTKDAVTSRKVMALSDKATISGTRKTADGYLVTEARVARGGNIQDYYGSEIGHADASRVFKVYRPENEIFKRDALASFAHKPVTMGHPANGVSPETWRKDAVGSIGSEVVRDGEFVRVPMVIMDAQAIADIESGVREISMGYDCELVMEAGTTKDGRAYDAYQRGHRMNHAAIVEVGRAGPQCRIGDQSRTPHQQQKDTPAMKTVTIDGKATEVTDEVAAHIAKLTADADTAKKVATDSVDVLDQAKTLLADLKSQKADADKAVADAKAEAKAAKDAVNADAIHAAAAELATVIDSAKVIAPDLDVKGKTVAAIKKDAVAKKLGDERVKDKSEDAIGAMFDLLSVAAADADPVARAIQSAVKTGDAGDKAFNDYRAGLSTAWQTPVAKN